VIQFEEVYGRYFQDVYKYALSLTGDAHAAEELTQETFFKALKSIDWFDGRCKLYVWLCQIAKNTYLTGRRRAARGEELKKEEPPPGRSPEELLLDRETFLEVHRLLHGLEEPYKEVFSLRAFGELSFRQIGELFGKTESWARVTYHRAKLKIKEGLQ